MFGARDWFGIKPLYTLHRQRGTFFASEKKSLLDVAGPGVAQDVDTTSLQHYLTLQYVPEPASMHRAIRRVESGTYFVLEPGRGAAAAPVLPPGLRDQAGARRGQARTGRSPRRSRTRSRSTCAPTSPSARSCPAASTPPRSRRSPSGTTRSCSPSPPGSSARATARSTWPPSRRRRSASSTSPRSVTAEEMMDTLPLIVWYLDDPVADPALVPLYFIAREARKHVKVVLSGEGADELFGGYTIYREPISLRAFRHLPRGCGAGSAGCRPASPRAGAARTCCAAARSGSRSATTATRGSSAPTRCRALPRASTRASPTWT